MGASVRNSARQVGHQVAKYIINTGLSDAIRSAEAIGVPSDFSMLNAGGISPTFVPSDAAGTGGTFVGDAAGAWVGGAGVFVATVVAVGGADVAVDTAVSAGVAAAIGAVMTVVAVGASVAG